MTRPISLCLALLLPAMTAIKSPAQMAGMDMKKSAPSTELVLTGIAGKKKALTPADLKAMPHVTVSVHNAHNNKDESYSGVPVKELLTLVEPAKGEGPRTSANLMVVIASATDNFHVAITLCDTNPECRNGQAIVADTLDGTPIAADGAFKLVLTEDKKPARWARNLSSLTVKAVAP
ncbi:hypothetical protein [Terriglobus roseus]|uniref:Oxidoreductase molybdopterin binding domain-containing protein n=1 Tax=Terriglobus roseus TaxID=392734 RepID=A0A1H4SR67_9BACT|nr:hypothetical protein [Terriglobus roseus]SEC46755.1 hypothetical protein SAMN05443244_3532 [Terriglobus roseus]